MERAEDGGVLLHGLGGGTEQRLVIIRFDPRNVQTAIPTGAGTGIQSYRVRPPVVRIGRQNEMPRQLHAIVVAVVGHDDVGNRAVQEPLDAVVAIVGELGDLPGKRYPFLQLLAQAPGRPRGRR